MSRVIKLRIWDKAQSSYITASCDKEGRHAASSYWSFWQRPETGDMLGFASPYQRDDFVLEQFTGLLDKNGREVYEGDIVRASLADRAADISDPRSFMVGRINYRADAAGFSICPDLQDTIHRFDISVLYGRGQVPERLEVVGNIHENPQLLTT